MKKWRLDLRAGLNYNCIVCKQFYPKKSVLHTYGRSVKVCDKCFIEWQTLVQDKGKYNLFSIPRAALSLEKVA